MRKKSSLYFPQPMRPGTAVVTVVDTVDVWELVWELDAVDDAVDETVDVCVDLSQTKSTPSALSWAPKFNASIASEAALALTAIPSFLHANTSVESTNVSYSCRMR